MKRIKFDVDCNDRYWYKPPGWVSRMCIRPYDENQLLVYDERNSFDMLFHKDDAKTIVDIIKRIACREFTSDLVQDYKSHCQHYMRSNHIDRARAPHIIDMIEAFCLPPIELSKIDIDYLKDTSLETLVAIYDVVKQKRKEKQLC